MTLQSDLERLIGEAVQTETYCATVRGKLVHRGTGYGFLTTKVNVQFHHTDVCAINVTRRIVTLKEGRTGGSG